MGANAAAEAEVKASSRTSLESRLERDKKETLVETNAQAIYENLTKLREFHSENRRRWVWELLQNAEDACDPVAGKNRVHIHAEEKRMEFRHNGAAFGSKEISHLIYHGSTKQEDEQEREIRQWLSHNSFGFPQGKGKGNPARERRAKGFRVLSGQKRKHLQGSSAKY